MAWGTKNKISFAPEKFEMIHITRKHDTSNPSITVNDNLTIHPVTAAGGVQPALKWLGVWFDRRLTFHRHLAVRAARHGVLPSISRA
jgi:hypothetical protein